ncbi:hypothetical protein M885DRAFT_504844 [Pelagophyceae sp. CCMP2097]|nr:hypothetical protein M885DRAFT_504844 [Pelagophyceae sp. CCMP2097]
MRRAASAMWEDLGLPMRRAYTWEDSFWSSVAAALGEGASSKGAEETHAAEAPGGDASSVPRDAAGEPVLEAQLLGASDIMSRDTVSSLEALLPQTLSGSNWRLLYSLQQHGANLGTFYAKVQHDSKTLVVVQTAKGDVVGGFNSSVWRPRTDYYGTGESYLFSIQRDSDSPCAGAARAARAAAVMDRHAARAATQNDPLDARPCAARPCAAGAAGVPTADAAAAHASTAHVRAARVRKYAWTGGNSYFMKCTETSIAMGGGGAFGLLLDDDFTRGSTGRSETFGNAPLCAQEHFPVLNFECWGFTNCTSEKAAAREDASRNRRKTRPVLNAAR